MSRYLKLHVDTGLVPRRRDADWDMRNLNGYLKNMTRGEKIEALIRAGVYNVTDPDVVALIREDFYARGSIATTPVKIVKKLRAEKMESLVRNGTYKTRSPGAATKMRKNFGLNENNDTPQRILAMVRKEQKPAPKSSVKPSRLRSPIARKPLVNKGLAKAIKDARKSGKDVSKILRM